MTASRPDDLPAAEDVFADYLEQLEEGREVDFDAVCAAHPAHADALRRMHVRWSAMTQAFTALSVATGAHVDAVSASVESLMAKLRDGRGRGARYAIGSEIARGAMGRVVSAWDGELRREVALKILRDREGDTRLQRRFLEEAQIAGQLDHPGIVPIHELGVDGDGQPFFAMRLVRGQDLGEVLEAKGADGWTRTRVLHVVLRVCEAMAYAHQKGVVHRDLKPGNVMVGRFGETYVMDWGLARVVGKEAGDGAAVDHGVESLRGAIAAEDSASPLLTQHGDVVGTPAYMAPELAAGGRHIAPTVDVYSLGAILHHLCAGRMPYLRDGEHATASEILARVRAGPPAPLPDDVPAELRATVERALARDPAQRYPSVVELADDLRAYLELRVVKAYATGRWAELRKWVVRNRALSIAIGIAIVALAVGAAVSTRLWISAEGARAHADGTAAQLTVELDRSEFRNARLSLDSDDSGNAEDLLWRQHLAGRMPRATAWALAELHGRSPCLATTARPTVGDGTVAFVPGTGEVVVGGADGRVRVLDGSSLASRRSLGTGGAPVLAIAVDRDGKQVFTGGSDGSLTVLDLATGDVVRRVAVHGKSLRAIAVAPHDRAIATGGGDGRVLLWRQENAEPQEITVHTGAAIWSLAFDLAGERLASGDENGRVQVVRLGRRGAIHIQLGNRQVMALSFTPGIDELWVGSATHQIFVVQTSPVKILRALPTRNGTCRDLLHDTDGSVLAGGWWRLDRIAADGARSDPVTLRGVWQLDGDRAARRVVASHSRSGISLIDLSQRAVQRLPGGSVALARDGRSIAVVAGGKVVVTAVDKPALDATPLVAATGRLAIDRDGTRVALLREGTQRVDVFDVASRRALFSVDGPEDPPFGESFVFRPDGRELAVVVGNTMLRRVDAATGAVLGEHTVGPGQILRLHYAADGATLAVLARDLDAVRLLSLADGTFRDVACTEPCAVALSPDGRSLAVGGWQGVVVVCDLATDARQEIRAHAGTIWSLAFAPNDPRLLISSGGANGVSCWDLDTGVCCYNILRDEAPAQQVQVSDDGRTLALMGLSGVVLWDLEYHERHVAGNLAYQVERLREKSAMTAEREAELRRWADGVLARPWPRWPAR